MDLSQLATYHTESHIDTENIEGSGGLSHDEAAKRLAECGKNILTPPKRMPEWMRFLLQFKNVFLILLNVCGILSIVAYVICMDIITLYLAMSCLWLLC